MSMSTSQNDVSASLSASPYLTTMLRVEFSASPVTGFAGKERDEPIPEFERLPIEAFMKGLDHARLEIHGCYASPVIANLLAHMMVMDGPEDFEAMIEDIENFGTLAEMQQWATISAEDRRQVAEETARLAGLCGEAWEGLAGYEDERVTHHSKNL